MMMKAPMMQARPPETTEICGVVTEATAPASKSPRRGPPLTTAMWMDDSRLLQQDHSPALGRCRGLESVDVDSRWHPAPEFVPAPPLVFVPAGCQRAVLV